MLIRHLWQLKTVVFLHWCLICTVLLSEVFRESTITGKPLVTPCITAEWRYKFKWRKVLIKTFRITWPEKINFFWVFSDQLRLCPLGRCLFRWWPQRESERPIPFLDGSRRHEVAAGNIITLEWTQRPGTNVIKLDWTVFYELGRRSWVLVHG